MRDTALWNEANTRLIREHFVAVAVNGMGMNKRKDADKEFLYDVCKLRLAGAGGNVIVVTASGKQLGGKNGVSSNLAKAWEEWKNLPDEERKPGAVKVPAAAPVADNPEGPAVPPPGTLILKHYYRTLADDGKGGLRYATTEDYPSKHWSLKRKFWFEAAPDFMWITQAEWKSIVPKDVKAGDTFGLPASIAERLLRFHTTPTHLFGESNGWAPRGRDLRGGKLTLTVTEATKERVRLRLDGFARLGVVYDEKANRERNWQKSGGVGYEPTFHGLLDWDRTRQVFTRFDIVALGDTYGTLGGDLRYFYRPGRHPMGIAFEMVDGRVPAHQVPPLGFRNREMKGHGYLGYGK